jgi:RHS repeat-associated protein
VQSCGSVVVRYQDNNNFYLVSPASNQVKIYEKLNGTLIQRAQASLPTGTIVAGTWYRLQVTAEGGVLQVYWNNQYVTQWTDATPWMSGKVGFRIASMSPARWRDYRATTGGPGQVVSAEDYDPWGLVLEGMSYVSGNPDTRYKFTGKERDGESGYDYFGARYYDARVGKFLTADPLDFLQPSVTPYAYVENNPLRFVDPTGMASDSTNGIVLEEFIVYGLAGSSPITGTPYRAVMKPNYPGATTMHVHVIDKNGKSIAKEREEGGEHDKQTLDDSKVPKKYKQQIRDWLKKKIQKQDEAKRKGQSSATQMVNQAWYHGMDPQTGMETFGDFPAPGMVPLSQSLPFVPFLPIPAGILPLLNPPLVPGLIPAPAW